MSFTETGLRVQEDRRRFLIESRPVVESLGRKSGQDQIIHLLDGVHEPLCGTRVQGDPLPRHKMIDVRRPDAKFCEECREKESDLRPEPPESRADGGVGLGTSPASIIEVPSLEIPRLELAEWQAIALVGGVVGVGFLTGRLLSP